MCQNIVGRSVGFMLASWICQRISVMQKTLGSHRKSRAIANMYYNQFISATFAKCATINNTQIYRISMLWDFCVVHMHAVCLRVCVCARVAQCL